VAVTADQPRQLRGPTDMIEPELFAAYRHASGYRAPCACGAVIRASAQDQVPGAVRVHNTSRFHRQWRAEQDAVEALRRPTSHPCTCHDHGSEA
jgi:hypothetical protein